MRAPWKVALLVAPLALSAAGCLPSWEGRDDQRPGRLWSRDVQLEEENRGLRDRHRVPTTYTPAPADNVGMRLDDVVPDEPGPQPIEPSELERTPNDLDRGPPPS